MRNLARIIAVIVILLLVAALLYMCTGPEIDDTPQPEPVAYKTCWDDSRIPVTQSCPIEPEPEVVEQECWDGSVIPITESCPIEPAPEPEVASCDYPGDGYTPYPSGFNPTDQYIEFDYPVYESGFNRESLPLTGDDTDACVILMFDVSQSGRPVDIEVYDSDVVGSGSAGAYEAAAVDALQTRRYTPGMRNDKPIRIDNNVAEVSFE